ncbi:hypothetical protein AAHE18_01G110800 [Arachis hypogaea]
MVFHLCIFLLPQFSKLYIIYPDDTQDHNLIFFVLQQKPKNSSQRDKTTKLKEPHLQIHGIQQKEAEKFSIFIRSW